MKIYIHIHHLLASGISQVPGRVVLCSSPWDGLVMSLVSPGSGSGVTSIVTVDEGIGGILGVSWGRLTLGPVISTLGCVLFCAHAINMNTANKAIAIKTINLLFNFSFRLLFLLFFS